MMGDKHISGKEEINRIGANLAERLEKSDLTEASLSKFRDEITSYDKDSQLAVARATFSSFQKDYDDKKTNRQLIIHSENMEKGGQVIGGYWLHAMSIELDSTPKPTNWSEAPMQSLKNSFENLITPDRQVLSIFEESQEEHKKQVAAEGAKPFRFLDFEALTKKE